MFASKPPSRSTAPRLLGLDLAARRIAGRGELVELANGDGAAVDGLITTGHVRRWRVDEARQSKFSCGAGRKRGICRLDGKMRGAARRYSGGPSCKSSGTFVAARGRFAVRHERTSTSWAS
jgi:hypothetical protein